MACGEKQNKTEFQYFPKAEPGWDHMELWGVVKKKGKGFPCPGVVLICFLAKGTSMWPAWLHAKAHRTLLSSH